MSARWSDRQQAMLREMGVTLWLPPQTDAMPLPEAAMPEPVPSEVTAPVPAAVTPVYPDAPVPAARPTVGFAVTVPTVSVPAVVCTSMAPSGRTRRNRETSACKAFAASAGGCSRKNAQSTIMPWACSAK